MDRLTNAELATMRAEHREESGCCAKCQETPFENDPCYVLWPCDAARLLHDFAPGPVPHLAGIADDHCHCGAVGMEMSHPRHVPTPEQQAAISGGLFGPTSSEELLR